VTRARLHYLESLDPVRSAQDPATKQRSPQQELQSAQVFVEVLLAIAFGQDIVVPHAFVADSFACQHIASTVLRAQRVAFRDDVLSGRSSALRLHLHGGHKRFSSALSDYFERIDPLTKDRPLHSALYPDIVRQPGVGKQIAEEISERGSVARLLSEISGDRWSLAAEMWRELSEADINDETLVTQPMEKGPNLDTRVREWLAHIGSYAREDLEVIDVRERLAHCLRKLKESSARKDAFNVRTPFHGQGKDTWSAQGATVHDILNSHEDFKLVREFITALYHRNNVASIGSASASYTIQGDALPGALLQFDAIRLAFDEESRNRLNSGGHYDLPDPFAFVVDADSVAMWRQLYELVGGTNSVDTLAAILCARQTGEWTRSLAEIRGARLIRARDRHADAVAHHVGLVARQLSTGLTIDAGNGGNLRLVLQGIGGGAAAALALASMNPWMVPMAAAAATVAPEGIVRIVRANSAAARTRRVRAVVGRLVAAPQ
jgi:hypothetical protein